MSALAFERGVFSVHLVYTCVLRATYNRRFIMQPYEDYENEPRF